VWARCVPAVFVAAALGGCSSMKAPVPEPTFAQVSMEDKTVLARAVDDFYVRYKASADATTASPQNAQALLNAGRVLIELRCEEYLDAIGQSTQAAGNLRQQTNLVGGLSSALMGVTGSSAKEIAGVASAFSFAGASMDAYSTAYLFADAGTSIIKLVHSSQELFMNEVDKSLQGAALNHTNAVHILLGYQSICRPAKIRALVNDAISKAQVVAEIVPNNGADLEVMGVLAQLSRALGEPISESDALVLYARVLKPADGSLKLASGTELNKVQIASLSNIFLPLGLKSSKVGERWRAVLNGATPPVNTPPPQELTSSANAAIKATEAKSDAAKAAGAIEVAGQTSVVTQKLQQAINEVLKGGDLEKAKGLADEAKGLADAAVVSAEKNKSDPKIASPASAAAGDAVSTTAVVKEAVSGAIARRDGAKGLQPRMSQLSLPIIGIAR